MELTYAELSSAGTVRPRNEDFVGFWQPESLEEKRNRGAIATLADGVGGQGRGDLELSSAGTVRPRNEDFVGFWQPESLEEKRNRGAIATLADGVGGQGRGDL